MATSDELKEFAQSRGADLVGVAPVGRFDGAPAGHHPEDMVSGARSVVVCAQRIPAATLDGPATAYHRALEVVHGQLDILANQVALYLESQGGRAVPVPSDEPYAHWDAEQQYGRGDLSHRHAAQAAGLGRLGKNSMLITPRYGNRVHLGSVVTDVDLVPDPVLDWEPCPQRCSLCLDVCPAGALKGDQRVVQSLCRPVVMERLPKGTVIESCRACRRACPAGLKRRAPERG